MPRGNPRPHIARRAFEFLPICQHAHRQKPKCAQKRRCAQSGGRTSALAGADAPLPEEHTGAHAPARLPCAAPQNQADRATERKQARKPRFPTEEAGIVSVGAQPPAHTKPCKQKERAENPAAQNRLTAGRHKRRHLPRALCKTPSHRRICVRTRSAAMAMNSRLLGLPTVSRTV